MVYNASCFSHVPPLSLIHRVNEIFAVVGEEMHVSIG